MAEDEAPPPLSDDDKNALEAFLRDATPSWVKDRSFFQPPPVLVDRTNVKRWEDYKEEVVASYETPDPAPQQITEETPAAAAAASSYAHQLEAQSVDQTTGIVTVRIRDGDTGGAPSDALMGSDTMTIALTLEGSEIWEHVTYDTSTLAITARAIGSGATVPTSTLGELYVPIGYVNWEIDPVSGLIVSVAPHNRHCGDINVQFIYGQHNGAPALFAVLGFDPIAAP
jgi:hypothetical protein